MRVRLAFPLSALVLLFLLQGFAALFATVFALVYDGVFEGRSSAWAQLLVPLAAVLAPLLPLARAIGRERLVATTAALTALARVALCFPSFETRWIASAVVVAAGTIFLSAAVGLVERRPLTAGAAAAILLEQLFRLFGWSWDVMLRGDALFAQLVLSAVAAGIAGYWLLQPVADDDPASMERRVGGMRLRGALVLGCTLFLEMAVLARPAVIARWTGESYLVTAVALIAVSAAAVVLLAVRELPVRFYRAITVTGASIAAGAAALAPGVGGATAALLLVAGHAAALTLLAPALTPAGGRRKGWALSFVPLLVIGFTAARSLAFFAAFTVPSFDGHGGTVLTIAGGLLVLFTLVLPRPLPAPRIAVGMPAALAAITAAIGVVFAVYGARATPAALAGAPPTALTVATWNIHLGFDQAWRFDPERIAETIARSDADVVALQEVHTGMLIGYGVDLPLWLGRRLGMEARFAPTVEALLGNALLTRVPLSAWSATPLPALDGDPKNLLRATIETDAGPLAIAAAHFGLTTQQQQAQVDGVLGVLANVSPVVFMGDLNAEPGSEVERRLAAAGFDDAFVLSGAPPANTWPAHAPAQRIDWIWVRGYDVGHARTSTGAGSDHLLVSAHLVAPAAAREGDVRQP